jgi:hypothetical protein
MTEQLSVAQLSDMREQLNNALASSRIEGLEPTASEMAELELVLSGQITPSELTRRILADARRTVG